MFTLFIESHSVSCNFIAAYTHTSHIRVVMKVMLPINCLGFLLLLYTPNKQSQCSRMPVCDYLQQAETPDSDDLMCDNNSVSVCVTSKKCPFQTNFGGWLEHWLCSPFASNFFYRSGNSICCTWWSTYGCAVAGLMKTSQSPLHHDSILLRTGTDTLTRSHLYHKLWRWKIGGAI